MVSDPVLSTKIFCRKEDVIRRDIADEIILVPIRGTMADMRKIFSLDAVADYIWLRLEGKRTIGEIHADVINEFDVESGQAAEDLAHFVGELLDADLIHEVS